MIEAMNGIGIQNKEPGKITADYRSKETNSHICGGRSEFSYISSSLM